MDQAQQPRITIYQLLRAMIDKGASDLHITADAPPSLRIDGQVMPLKVPPLDPTETKQLCYTVLSEEQKITFERTNELDLSFEVKNLSRFRANVFMQRGAVAGAFRAIPFRIATFEELLERPAQDPEWFWDATLKDLDLRFSTPYERVLDDSRGLPWTNFRRPLGRLS